MFLSARVSPKAQLKPQALLELATLFSRALQSAPYVNSVLQSTQGAGIKREE
jgi:hypothetical protein